MPTWYRSPLRGQGGAMPTATPTGAFTQGGGGYQPPAPPDTRDAGKFTLDMTDPGGSLAAAAGAAIDFLSPVLGGVGAGIGLKAAGDVLGGIGDAELPYLGGDPDRTNAHLSDVPGLVGDVINVPLRAVERTYAGQRVEAAERGQVFDPLGIALRNVPGLGATFAQLAPAQNAGFDAGLPADLAEKLDAGDSVDRIADELVARGAGFSQNPVTEGFGGMVLDPMNIIGPGLGKVNELGKAASLAVKTADDVSKLGLGPRIAGKTFDAATRGLHGAAASLTGKVLGPATSGALHALGGPRVYQRVASGFAKLDRGYGTAWEDATAIANAQLPQQVIASQMGEELTATSLRLGRDAEALRPTDPSRIINERLLSPRAVDPARLERKAETIVRRSLDDVVTADPAGLAEETYRRAALVTGSSVEDARRVIGPVDATVAANARFTSYGAAIRDFDEARAGLAASRGLDVDRLTLVARDTLTTERAEAIVGGTPEDIRRAVDFYPELRDRFADAAYHEGDVLAYLRRNLDSGSFVDAIRQPKTGKNPLPAALGGFRRKWGEFYDLGMAPKSGYKVIEDADGNVVGVTPFTQVISTKSPPRARNPLGQVADAMFRGIDQQRIISESRARFIAATRDSGISPQDARSIHRAVMNAAADAGMSPRGWAASRGGDLTTLLKDVLGPERFDAFTATTDPVYAVMRAFEGNLGTVGLTQKVTGRAKSATTARGVALAAEIAEAIYPNLRFKLNPMFQSQELVESPIYNVLRGVHERPMDDGVRAAYQQLTADFRDLSHLTDDAYVLTLAGSASVQKQMGLQSRIGRALSRFPNVKAAKDGRRAAQVLSEHGEDFRTAVQAIDPRVWKTMEDAYGTKDPSAIADAFLSERLNLTDPDGAVRAMDAVRTLGHDATEETVWQAFRDSLEQASRQAFRTHYFEPERSWFNRTVNHPYLGLYPASYMWGHVLPEFARFLFKRPFGLKAPLTGYAAAVRTQQAVIGTLASDPEARQWVDDNQEAIYLIEQLLPGTPTDLPANLPAWARHTTQDIAAGRTPDPSREAADTFANLAGPLKTGNLVLGAGADVYHDIDAWLTRAAAELDGQNQQAADDLRARQYVAP